MAKTDLLWTNAIDSSTFAAGSQASTLPADNLASLRFGRVWRSLATTSHFIATFAAVTSIDVLALTGCTLAATDQIRHRLFDGAGASLLDVTVSSGVLDGYGLHAYLLSAAVNAKSWRCDITASSRNADGFFDIKRAIAGKKWQPAIGMSRPWPEGWNDDADVARGTLSGAIIPGDGPRYRTMDVSLDYLSEAEKATIKEMGRLAGRRKQVFVIPDEDGDVPREAMLAFINKSEPVVASLDVVPPVYGHRISLIQSL